MSNQRTPRRFAVYGHRGARGHRPENTMAGFEYAIAQGADGLEMDVGLSRDRVLVVYHDRRLNSDTTRSPDGRYVGPEAPCLKDLTATELQQYDVGRLRAESPYARRFPEQTPVDGARIPTLEEVLLRVRAHEVELFIEAKLSAMRPDETAPPLEFARALAVVLRATGTWHRTAVLSFHWPVLDALRQIDPAIATACLTNEQPTQNTVTPVGGLPSPWTAGRVPNPSVPAMVQDAGAAIWAPHFRDLRADKVAHAHRLGLRVIPWTVNDARDMQAVQAMGADGLITDFPERADARGKNQPASSRLKKADRGSRRAAGSPGASANRGNAAHF